MTTSSNETILITGATGQLGGMIIAELLARTEPGRVMGMARSPDKAGSLQAKGVTVRAGDYTDPAGLRTALDGIRTLMLVSGTEIGPRVQQHKNVIDAAKDSGVDRVVYTSVVIAGRSPEPIFDDHRITEEYIQASGLGFTILRDNFYMDPYLSEISLAIQRGFYRSGGTSGSALVSRRDVARAAAAVLIDDAHAGRTYDLTGPALVDGPEFARIAAALGGKEVRSETVGLDEIQKDYEERGYPAEHMPLLLLLEETNASGLLANVSDHIERITAVPPESFEDFARRSL